MCFLLPGLHALPSWVLLLALLEPCSLNELSGFLEGAHQRTLPAPPLSP